jgi:hypothetical protein
MKKSVLSIALASVLILGASGAMAQETTASDPIVPNHPGINEINKRITRQQNEVDQNVANGTLTEKQGARDTKILNKEEKRMDTQVEKNGGYLTPAERRHDNRKLNKSHRLLKKQEAHPLQ